MPPTLPQTYQILELELLRIKVAHLEWQNAQLHAQQLASSREALIRKTLLGYVAEEELERYVIDLEAGTIRPREEAPGWEPTP